MFHSYYKCFRRKPYVSIYFKYFCNQNVMFLNFAVALGYYFYAVEFDKYLGVEEPNNTSSFYKKHKYNKLGLVSDKKKASNVEIYTHRDGVIKRSAVNNVVNDLPSDTEIRLRTSDEKLYINAHKCAYSLFSQILALRTADKDDLGKFKLVKGSQMGYKLVFKGKCAKYNPTKNKLSFESCSASNIVEFQILQQVDRDGLSKSCEEELRSQGIGVNQLEVAEITDDHEWRDYSNNSRKVFTKTGHKKDNINKMVIDENAVTVTDPDSFNFDMVKISRTEVPLEDITVDKFPTNDDNLRYKLKKGIDSR